MFNCDDLTAEWCGTCFSGGMRRFRYTVHSLFFLCIWSCRCRFIILGRCASVNCLSQCCWWPRDFLYNWRSIGSRVFHRSTLRWCLNILLVDRRTTTVVLLITWERIATSFWIQLELSALAEISYCSNGLNWSDFRKNRPDRQKLKVIVVEVVVD